MRRLLAQLDMGRVQRVDEKGERYYLDEKDIAAERSKAQAEAAQRCAGKRPSAAPPLRDARRDGAPGCRPAVPLGTDSPPPSSAKGVQKKSVPSHNADAAPPEPFAVQQARKDYPVTFYSAPGCDPCNDARALLNAPGVAE